MLEEHANRRLAAILAADDLSRGLLVSALGHLGEVDEAKRIWAE